MNGRILRGSRSRRPRRGRLARASAPAAPRGCAPGCRGATERRVQIPASPAGDCSFPVPNRHAARALRSDLRALLYRLANPTSNLIVNVAKGRNGLRNRSRGSELQHRVMLACRQLADRLDPAGRGCGSGTTVDRALRREPAQHERGVGAAEAERIGQRHVDRPACAPCAAPGRSPSRPTGLSRLSVGGAMLSRMASSEKIASTAPAAPSRWPIADLVDDIGDLAGGVAEQALDRAAARSRRPSRRGAVRVDVVDVARRRCRRASAPSACSEGAVAVLGGAVM